MFEAFEWNKKHLNDILKSKSDYCQYSFDVQMINGYNGQAFINQFKNKLSHTDFGLYKIAERFASSSDDKITLVIKSNSADNNTFLFFNFKSLTGQAKPYEITRISNLLKSCNDVQYVSRVSESILYKLSDDKYHDFLTAHIDNISDIVSDTGLVTADSEKTFKVFDEIGVLFSMEHALPREGIILREGEYDIDTAKWIGRALKFCYQLGAYSISKDNYKKPVSKQGGFEK